MKHLGATIVALIGFVFIAAFSASAATILPGSGGGTGYATTTAGNASKCLQVVNTNPLTYTFATCSGGGSGGTSPFDINGTIITPTSTATLVDFVSTIASTSQLYVNSSGTIVKLYFTNASGTNETLTGFLNVGSLWLNSSRFTSLTGTGLTNSAGVLTFSTTTIGTGAFTNDANFIILGSLSGLAPISYNSSNGQISFSTTSLGVGGFTNDKGYLTSAVTSLQSLTGALTIATSTKSNYYNVTSSGSVITLSIPSNLGFFANDNGFLANASITATSPITWSAGSVIAFSTTSLGVGGFTNDANYIKLTSLSGVSPISYNSGSGAISFVNPGFITFASSGTWTVSTTYNQSINPVFQLSGPPVSNATSSLFLLGTNFIANGSGSGTYIGLNVPSASTTDFFHLQVNSSSIFRMNTSTMEFYGLASSTNVKTGNASTTNITASGYGNFANLWDTGITSALVSAGSNGLFSAYAGSACTVGSLVTSISASGAVSCVATSTILSGYSTSTGANPTATAWTTAVNGTANTFTRSDGAPALDPRVASSSITINMYDATTTQPYNYAKWRTEFARTMTEISCNETNGTTTIEVYRASAINTTSSAALLNDSIVCGSSGTTDNSFASASLPAGNLLIVNVSSTAGTPKWTAITFYFTK